MLSRTEIDEAIKMLNDPDAVCANVVVVSPKNTATRMITKDADKMNLSETCAGMMTMELMLVDNLKKLNISNGMLFAYLQGNKDEFNKSAEKMTQHAHDDDALLNLVEAMDKIRASMPD